MLSANGSWCNSCARRGVAIRAFLTLADLGTEGDVLLRSADGGFLGGHGDGIWTTGVVFSRSLESSAKRRSRKALAMPRAAGRQNWKVRCRRPPRLVLALLPLLFHPAPAADGVRAPPLFPSRLYSKLQTFASSLQLALHTHPHTATHHSAPRFSALPRQLAVSCVC
jgi:hypothetical protein